MERKLQELQNALEYETDGVLAQLVAAQRVNEMVAQLQHNDQSVDVRPSSNAWTASVDSLLADLDNLRDPKGQNKPQRCS